MPPGWRNFVRRHRRHLWSLRAGRSLAEDFRQRFGQPLDEDELNQNHQIIIVAASLDDSTERIVAYLSERDIPINVLCFQVFTNGTEQLLSRAWLLDPVRTQVSASQRRHDPWRPNRALERRVLLLVRPWRDPVMGRCRGFRFYLRRRRCVV